MIVLALAACTSPPEAFRTGDHALVAVAGGGEDAAAAQDAWIAAHPDVPVAHRFRTIPYLLLGPPEPEPDQPAVPADVVVIDQGFDPAELAGGTCFAPDCGDGGVAATGGRRHGAHVVQVVRRQAPAARIVGVRVYAAEGPMRLADLLRALEWTLEAPPRVVNLSLGLAEADGTPRIWTDPTSCAADNPALAQLVGALRAAGTTVVAATGDDFASGARAPACLPGVVAVSAARGGEPTASANRWPDARLAPGVDVPVDTTTASGSSLAAAYVSGELARGP